MSAITAHLGQFDLACTDICSGACASGSIQSSEAKGSPSALLTEFRLPFKHQTALFNAGVGRSICDALEPESLPFGLTQVTHSHLVILRGSAAANQWWRC